MAAATAFRAAFAFDPPAAGGGAGEGAPYLRLREGDLVSVTAQSGEWWYGSVGAASGFFPASFVVPAAAEAAAAAGAGLRVFFPFEANYEDARVQGPARAATAAAASPDEAPSPAEERHSTASPRGVVETNGGDAGAANSPLPAVSSSSSSSAAAAAPSVISAPTDVRLPPRMPPLVPIQPVPAAPPAAAPEPEPAARPEPEPAAEPGPAAAEPAIAPAPEPAPAPAAEVAPPPAAEISAPVAVALPPTLPKLVPLATAAAAAAAVVGGGEPQVSEPCLASEPAPKPVDPEVKRLLQHPRRTIVVTGFGNTPDSQHALLLGASRQQRQQPSSAASSTSSFSFFVASSSSATLAVADDDDDAAADKQCLPPRRPWPRMTRPQRRNCALLTLFMAAVYVTVPLLMLLLVPPSEPTIEELRAEASARLSESLQSAYQEDAALAVLSPASLGDVPAWCELTQVLGVTNSSLRLVGAELVPSASSWLSGFAPRPPVLDVVRALHPQAPPPPPPAASSNNVTTGLLLEGVPVRVLRGSSVVRGANVSVTAALYVSSLTRDEVRQPQLAVRVDAVSAGSLRSRFPSLFPPGGWVGELGFQGDVTVLAATASLRTPSFAVERGLNVRARTSIAGVSALASVARALSQPEESAPMTAMVTWSSDFVPCALLSNLSRALPSDFDDRTVFQLELTNAALSFARETRVDVRDLVLRVEGAGLQRNVSVEVLAGMRVNLRAGGNSAFDMRIGGAWRSDGGVMQWAGAAGNFSLGVLGGVMRVRGLAAEASLQLPNGAASRTLQLRSARVSGVIDIVPLNTTVQVTGVLESGALALVATASSDLTLLRAICVVAGVCSNVTVVDELGLGSVRLGLAVASSPLVVDGVDLGAGLTLFADVAGFNLIPEVRRVTDAFGIVSLRARAGLFFPAASVRDTTLFIAFFNDLTPNATNAVAVPPSAIRFISVQAKLRPIAAPPTLSVGLRVEVSGLDPNGPLRFLVEGAVTGSASITVSGFLEGAWRDVGGVRGLVIADLAVTVGIGAQTIISELGLAGTVDFGPSTRLDVAVFLSSARNQYAVELSATNLSLGALVRYFAASQNIDWVNQRGVAAATMAVLDVIALRQVDVLVAPTAVTIGLRQIPAGFRIAASVSVLGADLTLLAAMSERSIPLISGLPPIPVQDFSLALRLTNLNTSPIAAALNAGAQFSARLKELLRANRQLCVQPFGCVEIPLGDIDTLLVNLATSVAIGTGITIRELSAGFSTVEVLLLSAGNTTARAPYFALDMSIFGTNVFINESVPIEFFSTPAQQAERVWSIVARQVPNLADTLARQAASFFCNQIKSICIEPPVNFGISIFCLSLPGIC